MSFCIRKVRVNDAPALAELVRELGDFSSVTREPHTVTLERAEQNLVIITSSDSHTLLVAENDGKLVGYCSAHWIPMMSQPEVFISELFVRASYRGRGVGTELLEGVKTEAKAGGRVGYTSRTSAPKNPTNAATTPNTGGKSDPLPPVSSSIYGKCPSE